MPLAKSLPWTLQHIDDDDVAAVSSVLRSAWLSGGPKIDEFERRVADYCRVSYAVAVSSATAGLHVALRALGVGPGDRVWTSPISFVASANCALYCGAEVDFVDIDARTHNLSPEELERKLAAAKKAGALPKAIVIPHYGGHPCDLQTIANLCAPIEIAIIEDAAHALGASYAGEPIGSCRHSDATVFSFHATKSIATGEGGMVVTNREDISQSVARLRTHGITKTAPKTHSDDAEPWEYAQIELGHNYRMTDIQAALGISQMAKLDRFVRRRAELAKRYDENLVSLALQLPHEDETSTSAWHLYPIHITAQDRKSVRRALYRELLRRGIRSQVHYIPIHTQPFYQRLGFRAGDFPVAERYYEGALSLPIFFDLTERDQDRVIEAALAIVPAR